MGRKKNALDILCDKVEKEMLELLEGKKRGPYKTDAEKRETRRKAARRQSPSERQDALFPGYEDIRRLQRGITEINDDVELTDVELTDDDVELTDVELTDDDDGQEEMDEAKEKKKNCSKGNPYHDSQGRWSSPASSGGSWSIANKSRKSGCKRGKASRPSGKQERWTKLPCGREDVDNPNKKAKNLCKGGTVKEEVVFDGKSKMVLREVVLSDKAISDERVEVPQDLYQAAKRQQELEAVIKLMKKKLEQASKNKNQTCPLSYKDALVILNSLDIAKKGKLNDPKKS